MCGIAGICHLQEPGPVSTDVLLRMIGLLQHRGPDESGMYVDDWVGMGNARLSIIDLSSGSQPIHNEDQTMWIVYNGEVFNYPELKTSLQKKGHSFYTNTDTEVVLHLYEERGSSCLDELNGQFALAIWSCRNRELLLARDRVGINPLYYYRSDKHIVFASEVKSILAVEEVPRHIDPIAMDQIFTFWSTLPGRTVFRGINELLPGHFLRLSGGKTAVRKYWDIPFCPREEQLDTSVEEICESTLSLLNDAIRVRLRADVPVGCYLSGGLDSSGLSTLVRRNFDNHLRTFGIHFQQKEFDESEHQNRMVARLGADHTSILALNEQIGSFFPEAIWHCETPLLRTAPVPLFMLSRAVRENGFKVVLTGEGADEIFGGYNIFRETKARRFWARQPDSKCRPMLIGRLYPYIFRDKQRAGQFIQSFFGRGLERSEDPFFSHLIRWQSTSRIKSFFSEELRFEIGDYSGYEELAEYLPQSFNRWDHVSRAQYLEILIFLSHYLLTSQGDRMAMAHSVEIRPPYLDHRIIEFMARVPPRWKIMGLNEKYLLKKVFEGILPRTIVDRPKQPYRAPVSQSFLNGSGDYVREAVSDIALKRTGLFNQNKVVVFFKKLQRTREVSEFDNMTLSGIVSSQIVFDRFIAHFPAREIRPAIPKIIVDKRVIFAKH